MPGAPPDGVVALATRARERRWAELTRRFPDLSQMRVVDLGGTESAWELAPVRPAELVLVNTDASSPPAWAHLEVADACAPPKSLTRRHFDLVYSSSLLEHLGGHVRRQMFADVVDRLAEHHWVQTPYRYFPIEPHWVFPGFQFLPVPARAAISRRWQHGHIHSDSKQDALQDVLGVELIDVASLRAYFPTSTIWCERFGGLVKSIVAIR